MVQMGVRDGGSFISEQIARWVKRKVETLRMGERLRNDYH